MLGKAKFYLKQVLSGRKFAKLLKSNNVNKIIKRSVN